MLDVIPPWRKALRLLTATVILGLILWHVEWPELLRTLGGIQTMPALTAALAFMSLSLLEACRLTLVTQPRQLPFKTALQLQIISSAPANLTPAQLGGDAYKVLRLQRIGFGLIEGSARLALLRFLSLFLVVLTLVILVATDPGLKLQAGDMLAGTASSALAAAYVLIALCLAVAAILMARAPIRRGALTLALDISSPTVALLFSVSALMLVLRSAVILMICHSLGLEVRWIDSFLISCLASVANIVPMTVAGLGVREGVIVGLLIGLGIDYDQAVGVALMSRLLMVLQGLLGVGWWLATRAN